MIKWKNGIVCTIPSELLRKNCPCALCKEERGESSHSDPLSHESMTKPKDKKVLLKIVKSDSYDKSIELLKIWSIGQYAIGMEWGDTHTSGIYTYELLYSLGNSNN